MQTARYLVAVLVELATGMQFGEGNFSGTALGLVLVVHLDAGGDAAPVVHHADAVATAGGMTLQIERYRIAMFFITGLPPK